MNKYDLAVLGSGPCGYVAGIRAAQSGMKVCVFERDRIGGVCLNWGCIPTKSLISSCMSIYNVQHAGDFGIEVTGYKVDYSKICERKDRIVEKLSLGIEMLMKNRKIELIKGNAEIKDPTTVLSGNMKFEVQNILIATGSLPLEIASIPFDGSHILSSSDILELKILPKSMIIVGGGVIGCEFSSIFNALGLEITVVEIMGHLLPNEDEEIAIKIEQIFKKKGIRVLTKTKVEKIEKERDSIKAILSNGKHIQGEKILVCIGRSPNSRGLGIENIGLEDNKGWIKVDSAFRTNIKNIYAAGDVKGGVLLAHVASKEGISSVENMCGMAKKMDYTVVPNCIFTYPEIATVGLTERQAKEKGFDLCVRKFLFSAIAKSYILGETEGFIKIVVDNKNDKIIGAQIIGPDATGLIAELSLCVQFGVTSERLADVLHGHPTLSEVIKEVADAVHNRAIHSL